MEASRSLGEAEAGLLARLREDGALEWLLGDVAPSGVPRIMDAWIAELLERPVELEFPRGSIIRAADDFLAASFGEVRLQLDWWVWPSGKRGGRERVDALDARTLGLLDDVHWTYGSIRLHAYALPGVRSGTGRLLRRGRDFNIGVGGVS